jgi:chemotaxis protein MotB
MVRHRRFSIAVLVAGLIVSGCVSTSEFKKMEEGKNQEISALKQEKTSLEQQKGELESQKATLEKDIAELKQQNSSLEQEKASMAANNQQTQKQYEELVQGLSKEVEKGELQVKQYKNMLSMNLESRIFFDSGKVTLRKEGKAILKKVGNALKKYENKIIRVVGHTDNVPVAKSLRATFPSNWDLSVARAANVVRYLQEVGVPPERMLAAGRAEYDPVASNDTPGGRQKNRRIEIMLLDKSLVSEMTRTSN